MTQQTPAEPLDCQAARLELPALLSAELEAPMQRRLEAHLSQCAACRDELDGHRRTLRYLKTWEIEPDTDVTEAARPGVRRRRMITAVRPVLVGSAAAAVVFAALGLVGADANWADGRLTLTLGRQGEPDPGIHAVNADLLAPTIRELAGELFDDRLSVLLAALEKDLANLGDRQEERRLLLARAVDLRRNLDWRQLRALIDVLAARQDAMANWVTTNAPFVAPENLDQRKERS